MKKLNLKDLKINMCGAWQREFFFKASYENLETSTTEFNLMQEMGLFGSWEDL